MLKRDLKAIRLSPIDRLLKAMRHTRLSLVYLVNPGLPRNPWKIVARRRIVL